MKANSRKNSKPSIEDLERLLAARLGRESKSGRRAGPRKNISAFMPPVAHIRRSSGRLWLSRAENCVATTADGTE